MGSNLGREEASALCESLYPRVYGALALYTADESLAEELTQEVMLRLWQSWPTASEADRPEQWALTVAFNVARSKWRRLRLERRAAGHHTSKERDGGDLADTLAVRAAVAALPSRQRAAIVLRYFNDLTVNDTAVVLGCADGTVKALTSQAITNLRSALHIEIQVAEEDTQ